MSKKVNGITVDIGGNTSELKKSLSEVNKDIKSTQTELNKVKKALKADPGNSEMLAQKQMLLQKEISQTTNKLNALRDAKKRADAAGMDNSSDVYRELTRDVVETEDALEKLEKQLKDVKKTSDKTGNAYLDFGDKLSKVGSFTKVTAAMDVGKTILGAIKGAWDTLTQFTEETREFRTEMGKLEVSFESNNHSAETAKKSYEELFKVIGETDQAVEASQQISLLAKSEEQIVEWSRLGAGVVGKFGDALQPETFFEAANETLSLGKATGAYVQMLEQTHQSVEEFDKGLAACNTEEEKQAYLLEYTKKTLGDTAEMYRETNASIIEHNEATLKAQEAQAALGAAIEPIVTNVKGWFAELGLSALEAIGIIDDGIETETEKTQRIIEESEKVREAYQNRIAEIDKATTASLAETEYCKNLLGELKELGGEQGKIAESEKARAEYIINELNEALGSELTLNDLISGSYDSICGSIEETIKKKEAMILLEAQEEKYAEAVVAKAEAEARMNEIDSERVKIISEIAYYEQLASENPYDIEIQRGTFNELSKLRGSLAELDDEYNGLSDTVSESNTEIQKYTEASAAAIEGDTEKVKDALYGQGEAYIEAKDIAIENEEEKVQILGQKLADATAQYALAYKNNQELQTAESKKALEAAQAEVERCKTEYEAMGGAIVDGMVVGLNGRELNLEGALKTVLGKIPDWAKKLLGINSPAKVMIPIGEAIPEGVGVGIKKADKKAVEAFQVMLDKLDAKKDLHLISDEEYYTKLEEYRDTYFKRGEQEWLTYYKKVYDYQRGLFEDAKKEVSDALDDLIEVSADKFGKVLENRDKFSEKLKDYGSLYEEDAVIDTLYYHEGSALKIKEIKGTKLADLSGQTETLKKYAENLKKVKERGDIPADFFEILRDLSVEEGLTFTNALLSASDEDFNNYIEGWKNKQAAADAIADELYQDDLSNVTKAVDEEFLKLPEELKVIGQQAGEAFATEMEDTIAELLKGFAGRVTEEIAKEFPGFTYKGVSSVELSDSIPTEADVSAQGGGASEEAGGGKSVSIVIENNNNGVTPETAHTIAEQTRRQINDFANGAI